MLSPFIQKALVVGTTLIVLLYVGFGLLNKTTDMSSDVTNLSDAAIESQEIITLVDKVNSMSIDSSIFSSQLFAQLIDVSATITPEPYGRQNPFAPIGVDTITQNSISSTKKIP